jgi:hypothetical protein
MMLTEAIFDQCFFEDTLSLSLDLVKALINSNLTSTGRTWIKEKGI